MAWNNYDLITASKLNSENAEMGYFEGTLPDSSDWIEDYIGNDGIVYSHVSAGKPLFWARFKCGLFGGGKFRIVKWVNNGWNETVYSIDFGWNTNTSITINSTGPGKYRIYSASAFQFAAIPWKIWFGQTDCKVGAQLVEWNNWKTSLLHKETEELITVSKLNSGYIGTKNFI